MTYFREKLTQLLVSIARKNILSLLFNILFMFFLLLDERDRYHTLYLKEQDRRLAAELRLKENNNTIG